MKRLVAITFMASVVLCSATSCSTSPNYWGGNNMSGVSKYEDLTYRNYNSRTPESICDLLCLYEDMITNPGGLRQVPPPGICAEFGYLLLQPDTAEIFAAHASQNQKEALGNPDASSFQTLGKQMLEKEIELYPESEAFIGPLIRKFTED